VSDSDPTGRRKVEAEVAKIMAPKAEEYIRWVLENEDHGLASMRIKDLDDFARHLTGRATPFIAETADAVAKERADRLEAARNGPVFERGQVVTLTSLPLAHPQAGSPMPPLGIRGKVVRMLSPDDDRSLGFVHVRFPAAALGYGVDGDEEDVQAEDIDLDDPSSGMNYGIPNIHLSNLET
jgi:hypothetical protein